MYKVGDAYFVRDGNHRVSVARSNGQTHIEAYVTEVFTRVPLNAGMDLDGLIIKEEYAEFLEETHLDILVKEPIDLSVTVAGAYIRNCSIISAFIATTWASIFSVKCLMTRPVLDWYNTCTARWWKSSSSRVFYGIFQSGRKPILYIWMLEYRAELEKGLGWKLEADAAAETIAEKFTRNTRYTLRRFWYWLLDLIIPDPLGHGPKTGSWRQKHHALARKNLSFFRNIFIALQENDVSHEAFEEAIWVAKREGARISALHLVDSPEAKKTRRHLPFAIISMAAA